MVRSNSTMGPAPEAPTRGSLVLAGPTAGLAGGVVMAAFLVGAAATQGVEPLAAIEPMGATFRGPDFEAGARDVLFGVVLHLGVSALVGLVFAAVMPRDFPGKEAGVMCIGLAFVVMGFMTSSIVPAVNPVLKTHFHELGGSWVIAHALFGLTTGYVCQKLRRALEARAAQHVERAVA